MPIGNVNGIRLSYEETGSGDPVVMIMGSGSGGRAWHLHQVPALVSAGHRVITFDNRGIPPTDVCATGFTIEDLVGDVLGLMEKLRLGPVRVVGTSMGAYAAQELALHHPQMVRQAVFMASRARSDALRRYLAHAERDLYESGAALPPRYQAVVLAMQCLSSRTLDDEQTVADWLDLLEMARQDEAGKGAQLRLDPMPDRRSAYARISVPCHVISFADDLITPPRAGEELAAVIPGATFEVIPDAGHYGYLENPEAANKSILEFFRSRT
ncbi:Pimeloyl-ACP methyl ester carboxylesterase [Streptomyces sp. SceaMP-e96]|uniref:alpha/beta fold hydrolase n=1 Tax=Streptomyces TaxID=1883 RepID=UPI000823914A|nr:MULTISPECIES: alpha/beta hydrolase [unclassified Streptomyces]MYT16149.1 alpha/beta fold hydrolase [Streptomyces sp. SID4951]SCK30675.1 Pimeloyl-ACP methyl ester carboxylesterase [Streptomyces sp. SceaMP-e96]